MSNLQFDDVVFTLRAATQEEWENSESILATNEPGYAIDTFVLKLGDGTNLWKDLKAVNSNELAALSELIATIQELANSKYTKPETGIPLTDLGEDVLSAITNIWEE